MACTNCLTTCSMVINNQGTTNPTTEALAHGYSVTAVDGVCTQSQSVCIESSPPISVQVARVTIRANQAWYYAIVDSDGIVEIALPANLASDFIHSKTAIISQCDSADSKHIYVCRRTTAYDEGEDLGGFPGLVISSLAFAIAEPCS